MFSSITSAILSSLSDASQNPVSIVIFSILFIFIIALTLAIFFSSWRDALISLKLLEEDEEPKSLLIWIISIIIIVKLVQAFIVQPFIVEGDSMLPTYVSKEFLLVDKLSYLLHEPKRGDVMIFKLYENNNNPYEGKHLIKRVIGLPGERVVVYNGVTTIYNKSNPNGFILDERFVENTLKTKSADITLDDHHYFMMGDNRAQSYDSRDWGALDADSIRGQVLFRIFPFTKLSYKPGQYTYTK
ncbi:MAG: signal peptidase I [Candidatus Pacebacteria bacterium]|nr:signal peptidase I [Candidatus Paceibacterota bacterium]MBP9866472.1 signal peptidase I [Candidatus Paceibacterota bacterium]